MENDDDEDACIFIASGRHDKHNRQKKNGFILCMLELF